MMYFNIPFRLPSLNDYINKCRSNKFMGAKFKKDIEEQICACILSAKNKGNLKAIAEPVHLLINWTEPNARRDVDNIQSGQKYILDALQKSEILPNDSQKYVKQIIHLVNVKKGTENVEVIIEEVNEDGQDSENK